MTYGVLSFGYFHFINLGETARRIRIIREIDAAGRPLTREVILDRYTPRPSSACASTGF